MSEYNLQPLPLRDEAQPGYEAIAWKPNWKCFCCHDNGIIPERIVKTVIPNYVSGRHKPVKCNNCNIRLGDTLYDTNTLDLRFTPEICDRLDRQERQMWREWGQEKHELRKQRLAASKTCSWRGNPAELPCSIDNDCTRNLRRRSRSNQERAEAQRRHRDISAN